MMMVMLLPFYAHSRADTPQPIQYSFFKTTYSPPPPHHTSPPPPPPPSSHTDTIIIVLVSVLVAIILIGGGIWYLYQYMEKKRVKREVAEIGDLSAVPMGDADHIYCY
jgi:hypothetical protein